MKIEIQIDDEAVRAALKRLEAAAADLTPAMQDIGELLVERTKRRFATGTGPDGTPWARNAPLTVKRKRGRDQPLVGESGRLSNEIFAIAGLQVVEVGSALVYSAVQQFGAAKGQFGRSRRGRPIPWGAIPARPFLGLAGEDRLDILDILAEHLATAAGPR
jgi:phage virion morphogenesis protein